MAQKQLKKKDRTHRALMHSAKQLFEQNGIGNVTIDRISENAGVSRSTFFTHFTSLDDLLKQIADEEINDILSLSDGKPTVSEIFTKLTEDTYPYPSLMMELFLRSIIAPGVSTANGVDRIIINEISEGGFKGISEEFSAGDVSAFILGAYFGLVFQKFMNNEAFENPDETNDKIQRYINYLKKTGGNKQ